MFRVNANYKVCLQSYAMIRRVTAANICRTFECAFFYMVPMNTVSNSFLSYCILRKCKPVSFLRKISPPKFDQRCNVDIQVKH